MPELYIGLMSGTSMDGIDAVVVDLSQQHPKLIASYQHEWPKALLQRIKQAAAGNPLSATDFARLDSALGSEFAIAANQVAQLAHVDNAQIIAIGSHGQTLAHAPDDNEASSLQLGDPNQITEHTQITTVADFRRRDIAAGGQGAPLVPAFHAEVFNDGKFRIILNIGGIANVTVIPGNQTNQTLSGFDTGTGNCLIDLWYRQNNQGTFDKDGQWASTGKIDQNWLQQLLQDNYFKQAPPKSTGTQYFSEQWLKQHINKTSLSTADIQATLTEFSAITITDAIKRWGNGAEELIVCGGGVHNVYLMERLADQLSIPVYSSEKYSLDPDWVEAMAFAWLAKQALAQKPANNPDVTGSKGKRILGGIYQK